jgi:hypothetical protein
MQKFILVTATAFLLSGCTLTGIFNKKPAGLEIMTTQPATVVVNGGSVGTTPYSNKTMKPGNYTIKLTPTDPALAPWESQYKLESEVTTVISRTFAPDAADAYGYTLELRPEVGSGTYLSVISDPDTVSVTLDGKAYGFTPLSKLETTPGTHALTLSSPGFQGQELSVNTVKGYNLIVNAKMAGTQIVLATPAPTATPTGTESALLAGSPRPSASPLASPVLTLAPPYVTVENHPDIQGAGGLNVRKEASASSDPLGKARIGERLKYLGETTPAGWFKVEFENQPGWVSGKYVSLTK